MEVRLHNDSLQYKRWSASRATLSCLHFHLTIKGETFCFINLSFKPYQEFIEFSKADTSAEKMIFGVDSSQAQNMNPFSVVFLARFNLRATPTKLTLNIIPSKDNDLFLNFPASRWRREKGHRSKVGNYVSHLMQKSSDSSQIRSGLNYQQLPFVKSKPRKVLSALLTFRSAGAVLIAE